MYLKLTSVMEVAKPGSFKTKCCHKVCLCLQAFLVPLVKTVEKSTERIRSL